MNADAGAQRRRARRQLAASAIGLLNTANALRPFSRSGYVTIPNFATGLPVSELPLVALAISAARLTYALARGRVRGTAGAWSSALTAASWIGLAELYRRGTVADRDCERALVEALGPDYRSRIRVPEPPGKVPTRPPSTLAMVSVRKQYVREDATIAYGPHGSANLLDVWRHRDLPRDARAPVLVQVPGGAWVLGNKENQAYPLLSHLAARGWICVSISYRLAPRHPWPAQIHDVKRALAWVKSNIADFGGIVKALRDVSRSTVAYLELPGAQHAFEVFGSPRARHTTSAVESFLNSVWTSRTAANAPAAR